MSHLQLKIGFAVVGLLVFGYGLRVDDGAIRWVGIAFVGLAFLLRFWRPGRNSAGEKR